MIPRGDRILIAPETSKVRLKMLVVRSSLLKEGFKADEIHVTPRAFIRRQLHFAQIIFTKYRTAHGAILLFSQKVFILLTQMDK